MASLTSMQENRLLRYLYTGHEDSKYYSGYWSPSKYYKVDSLPVLNEIFETNNNNTVVPELIFKAFKSGHCTRYETVAFALNKCLLLGSPAVRQATYAIIKKNCKTAELFLLFCKFNGVLKIGNGCGWRKVVQSFYLQNDPMELAKETAKFKTRHGCPHKILIKLSHLKVPENDHAHNAVVRIILFGLKKAKQLTGVKDETEPIFEYAQKLLSFRCCEDPVAAARIATENKYTLDHVPAHLLTSQEVWNAILPQMGLEDLLKNIMRIHNMGFLTKDSPTTAIMLSMLSNQNLIKKAKLSPLAVYLTMCNYKAKFKPIKFPKITVVLSKEKRRRDRQTLNPETGIWQWTVTRRHPKEVKTWGIDLPPNKNILEALTKLMDKTWTLGTPTRARYMITMDMRDHMFKGRHFCKKSVPVAAKKRNRKRLGDNCGAPAGDAAVDAARVGKKRLLAECFYQRSVTPGHAALVLALQLLKREKDVKLAVFSEAGVQIISLDRNFSSVEEAEVIFRRANLGRVQPSAPMDWAIKKKHKVDVFINMIDRSSRFMELEKKDRGERCAVKALQRYRAALKLPDTKLIVMSLATHRMVTADGTEGVLEVAGVDEHVPKLINSFALGHFK